MRAVVIILLVSLAVSEASLKIRRTSRDGRHPTAMELEVQLPQSGKKLVLPLKRNDKFEDVPVTVSNEGVERTFSSRQIHHPSHAHYEDVASRSVISVRDVGGVKKFNGHFHHQGQSYFVQPQGDGHVIKANSMTAEEVAKQLEDEGIVDKVVSRRRRQSNSASTTYTIELQVVVDSSVWQFFSNNYGTSAMTELHYYYTHIMNGVNVVYKNIGNPSISIEVIKLVVSQSQSSDKWMPSGSSRRIGGRILEAISSYRSQLSPKPDHVMAFTRLDIMDDRGQTGVCGMAYVAAACTDNGVSINEDMGLHSWGTAAHELGHNMGSRHDGSGNSCNPGQKNVMAPSLSFYNERDVRNSYRFSSCSISQIQSYLSRASCLKQDAGSKINDLAKSGKEGTRLTLDQVCKASFPDSAGKYFESSQARSNPASICSQIYCQSGRGGGTSSGGLRAPVGTKCGSQKTCNWNGECTYDSQAPTNPTNPTNPPSRPNPTNPPSQPNPSNCPSGDLKPQYVCNQWVNAARSYPNYCPVVKRYCCKSAAAVCP